MTARTRVMRDGNLGRGGGIAWCRRLAGASRGMAFQAGPWPSRRGRASRNGVVFSRNRAAARCVFPRLPPAFVDQPRGARMWIVRLALRRPYTIAVMALLILVLGTLSLTRMIVDIFPAIDIPVVAVVWNYPGLSAEEMERRGGVISERGVSTTGNGGEGIESPSIPHPKRVAGGKRVEIGGCRIA